MPTILRITGLTLPNNRIHSNRKKRRSCLARNRLPPHIKGKIFDTIHFVSETINPQEPPTHTLAPWLSVGLWICNSANTT